MKKTDTNLTTLKDFINEQFLIEQVASLYGCPPGYGHNPFTDTCYPIPNKMDAIKGLEGPRVIPNVKDADAVDEPGPDPTDPDQVKALAVKMAPFWNNPVEGTKECYDKYPISSLVGTLLGASSAQYGLVRTGLKVTVKPAMAVLKTSLNFKVRSLVALGMIGYVATKYFEEDLDQDKTVGFLNDSITGIKRFLNSEWTDWTYAGAACAANLLASTYFLAKGGKFLGKTALKTIVRDKDFLKEMNRLLGRKTIEKLGKKPTHATLWIALKQRRLLPKGKDTIELSKEGLLVIPKGDRLSIPVNKLNKKNQELFKQFVRGDQIILDLNKASDQFRDASNEIIHMTAATYQEQAKRQVKNSGMLQDFQKLVKIIGKDGSINKKKLINNYLKETANLLENFTESSRPQLKKLYEDGLKLKRTEPVFVKEGNLNKLRQLVARGDSPSNIATKQKLSPQQQRKLQDYLELYKDFVKNEQDMASKFVAIKSFMEKEAAFSKLYGKNVDLRTAILSGQALAEQKRITGALNKLKFYSKQMREVVVGTNIRSVLTDSAEALTFVALAGGMTYVGAVLVPKWRNELSLPYIYESAEEFFKQKGEGYLQTIKKRRSSEINLKQLFDEFATFYKEGIKPGENFDPVNSIALVKEFCDLAPTNPDVKKHLSGKNISTTKRLKQNFLTLLIGQFGGTPGEKPEVKPDGVIVRKNDRKLEENKGVQIMSKKTLKQLVSEILNENSGQGYAKYPYHANEYSEGEPDEDYMVEWKGLVDEVCGSKKKNVDGDPETVEDSAIEVAKLLVKDSDLFRDVLEMAGANKSIGVEIMRQLKDVKDKKS